MLTLADMSREIFRSGDRLACLSGGLKVTVSRSVSRSPVRLRDNFCLFISEPWSVSSSLLIFSKEDILFLSNVLAGMGGGIFSTEVSSTTEESTTNRVALYNFVFENLDKLYNIWKDKDKAN